MGTEPDVWNTVVSKKKKTKNFKLENSQKNSLNQYAEATPSAYGYLNSSVLSPDA
jgi:hypothetical protein